MSHSKRPSKPDMPDASVSDLQALYREAATDEPGPLLDRIILDAAQAEIRQHRATRSSRQTPWWKTWLPATTAIVAVVVGLSVTWRVMDEQERRLREEVRAGETERQTPHTGAAADTLSGIVPAPDRTTPAAPKRSQRESVMVPESVRGEAASAASPAARNEPQAFPTPAAPATMAPAPMEVDLKKDRRAASDELRQRRDANTAADSASGLARQAGKLEVRRSEAGVASEAAAGAAARPAAKTLAAPAADAATPEAWLQQIRQLRAAGRDAEAAQSLSRFRARYPDFVLPADLIDSK